jgi:hypothetical protein
MRSEVRFRPAEVLLGGAWRMLTEVDHVATPAASPVPVPVPVWVD